MNDTIKKISNMNPMPDNPSLADRINFSARGSKVTHSGRGHGRKTHHGRGPRNTGHVPRNQKRDMLYFVRDIVKELRMLPSAPAKMNMPFKSSHELANALVNDIQFFDCDCIAEYVGINWQNCYHEKDVPPHPDVILPAECVGLYFKDYATAVGAEDESSAEVMFLCVPVGEGAEDGEYKSRLFNVYIISFLLEVKIMAVGQVVNHPTNDDRMFDLLAEQQLSQNEEAIEAAEVGLRLVAFALQTINQPRFVIYDKRDVSLMKRQAFKKSTGRFTPDSWNLVSWNIDKPVKAKTYDEGTGGRQALHYRRGHYRKAEEDWPTAQWSNIRNRWEQYIHGYEAGHPAFGVKKSYHLPRKELI